MSFVLIGGCAEKSKTPTDFKMAIGAATVGLGLNGGLVLTGTNGEQEFAVGLSPAQLEDFSIELASGNWIFKAVGWLNDFSEGHMTGGSRCGFVSTTIEGENTTVSLSLSQSGCQKDSIVNADAIESSSPFKFKTLNLDSCQNLENVLLDPTGSCDSASLEELPGHSSSVQIILPGISSFNKSLPSLSSQCYNIDGSGSGRITTSLRLPAGASSDDFPFEIKAYEEEGCQGELYSYEMPDGLDGVIGVDRKIDVLNAEVVLAFAENSAGAPVASALSFSGMQQVGETLTGVYTYSDVNGDIESGTTFRWLRSDDASGSNKSVISGATSLTYTLQAADAGKYISFEVTPGANAGVSPGRTVKSSFLGGVSVIPNVAAGNFHTCALLGAGNVRCWGASNNGQLGYGNTDTIGDNEDPVTAGDVNVGGIVTQISAKTNAHTCALLSTGSVRCWGDSSTTGQLGYGNTDTIGDNEDPAAAGDVNMGGAVTQIAAGSRHTCALLDTGNVRCWGDNGFAQLGYGNTNTIGDDEDPAAAGDVNVGGIVTQIDANTHTCALLDTGNVRCWGTGSLGRLGYGNTDRIGDNEDPATAGDVNVGGTVTQISVGGVHTCALLDTGKVRCWGSSTYGQLGYGNTNTIGDDEDPATAGDVNVGGTVTQISAGSKHTCALLNSGNVRCWGQGSSGQLGYGNIDNIGDNEDPAIAGDVNVGGTVTHISAGVTHTCALLDTGGVRCWGSGGSGKLGYGNIDNIGDNEAPDTAGDVFVF